MLTDGRSLSGHERNCCFLNTATQRFADVSAATGLDQLADSRGVAVVDWDLDGDLDFWISNRTAPRIRFLRNEIDSGHHYLAVKLEGVTCNRDAIGARVELISAGPTRGKHIRTLRAGEGYLAQSSKWLHFGLGKETAVQRLVVRWPDGKTEHFQDMEADRRYRLVQGSGLAQIWQPPARQLRRAVTGPPTAPEVFTQRLVPHRRLPLPRLPFIDFDGQPADVNQLQQGAKLISLWATWCQPCLRELTELARHDQQLREIGLTTIPINVDDVQEDADLRRQKAKLILEDLGVPVRGGVAVASLVDALDVVQRVLVSKHSPLAVPTSFLIDREGRLAVVYRGMIRLEQLTEDVENLSRPGSDLPQAAVPFAGRWYVNPLPLDLLAVPQMLLSISSPAEALDYLRRHARAITFRDNGTDALREGLSADRLAGLYFRIGVQLAKQQDRHQAIDALVTALSLLPDFWDARAALASVLELEGRTGEAVTQYRSMLQLRPGHPVAANNLAWILATSSDTTIRDAEEAIKQALHVCQVTNYRVPSALDTLAAAYAAAGRFDEAVDTADKAIQIAATGSQHELAEKIRGHREKYKQKRLAVEP